MHPAEIDMHVLFVEVCRPDILRKPVIRRMSEEHPKPLRGQAKTAVRGYMRQLLEEAYDEAYA